MSKVEELSNTASSLREKPSFHTRASSDSGILSPEAPTSAAAVRKHILGSASGHREASDPKPVPSKSFRPPPKLHRPAESGVGGASSRLKTATTGAIQSDPVIPSLSNITPTVSVARPNEVMTFNSRTTQAAKDTDNAVRAQQAIKARKPMKSNLSSVGSDRSGTSILGHEEHKMDDLLKQLKTGSVTLPPATAVRISSSTIGSTPRAISHTHVPVPVSRSRTRNLAPLASGIFKDEVKNSLSRVKRSPAKKPRSVLTEVDINHTSPCIDSCGVNKKQSIGCSGTSAKALGKRKAILLEHRSLYTAIDVDSKFALDESDLRANFRTIESHHLSPLTPGTSITRSVEGSGGLSAEKALLSLERICAGFSSGSLGSLESISDLLSGIDPLADVPSPYRPSLLSSPFRPTSTSSPKTTPHSTTRTPLKYTSPLHFAKVTSAVSFSSNTTKKPIRKCTSILPLRIEKGSVSVRPSPVRL
ncbi:hypothetical protein C0995_015534 [Termitomyces sp. Mi166|nr:hypothetical protein C0995_015534 [Termitomyces sp. Mi166\